MAHLILSNILYKFFKGTYEESIFEFNFYFNHLKILEYLAFLGDLFNGVSGAYNAVNNVSLFLVYPLLKRRNLINPDDLGIKKKLEEINDKISSKQNELNDLTESTLSESRISVQSELDKLKNIQQSYEYQIGVGTKKSEKSKQDGKLTKIINIVKVIQGLLFIITSFLRILTIDYKWFNEPVDLKEESIVQTIHRFLFFKFSSGFINFVEQTISLSLVFALFGMNWSVSRDRIMECISYVFSYLKSKKTYYDVQLLIACIMTFSYYLICGLLVTNSMPNVMFKYKLHAYLFPGFDFENLHFYYDVPYASAATAFIIKEIIEYSNIISVKQKNY